MAKIEIISTKVMGRPIQQQHKNWIEWYKTYIQAVRNGERPEYKSRDTFNK